MTFYPTTLTLLYCALLIKEFHAESLAAGMTGPDPAFTFKFKKNIIPFAPFAFMNLATFGTGNCEF